MINKLACSSHTVLQVSGGGLVLADLVGLLIHTWWGMLIFNALCLFPVKRLELEVELCSQSHSQGDGSAVACSLQEKILLKLSSSRKGTSEACNTEFHQKGKCIQFLLNQFNMLKTVPGYEVEIVSEKDT